MFRLLDEESNESWNVSKKDDEEQLEIFRELPLDWSLKTSAKFLSSLSFDVQINNLISFLVTRHFSGVILMWTNREDLKSLLKEKKSM